MKRGGLGCAGLVEARASSVSVSSVSDVRDSAARPLQELDRSLVDAAGHLESGKELENNREET